LCTLNYKLKPILPYSSKQYVNIGGPTQVIAPMFVESVVRVMVTRQCFRNTLSHTVNTNHSHVIHVGKASISIGILQRTKRHMQRKVLLVVFTVGKYSTNEVIC